MKPARPLVAALLLALTAVPAFGDAPEQADPPGTGVVCAWALLAAASEVGRQCFPGQDSEFQAELAADVSRIEDYVARNGGLTPAEIADFRAKQGHVGDSKEFLCKGDPQQLYLAFRQQNLSELRSGIDDLLAKPGEPTWGTCT